MHKNNTSTPEVRPATIIDTLRERVTGLKR